MRFIGDLLGNRNFILKVDTEGAELSVINGMKELLNLPTAQSVIIEINDSHLSRFGHTAGEIYETLGGMGFHPETYTGTEKPEHYDEVFTRRTSG